LFTTISENLDDEDYYQEKESALRSYPFDNRAKKMD
jgi:hypothetical protein